MVKDGEQTIWVVARNYGDCVLIWADSAGVDVGTEPDEVTRVSEEVLVQPE